MTKSVFQNGQDRGNIPSVKQQKLGKSSTTWYQVQVNYVPAGRIGMSEGVTNTSGIGEKAMRKGMAGEHGWPKNSTMKTSTKVAYLDLKTKVAVALPCLHCFSEKCLIMMVASFISESLVSY